MADGHHEDMGNRPSPLLNDNENKYFNFSPPRFVDDVFIMMENYLEGALAAFKGQIHKDILAVTNMPDKTREVEACVAKLQKKLEQSTNINFDKFELYVLRNLFAISKKIQEVVDSETGEYLTEERDSSVSENEANSKQQEICKDDSNNGHEDELDAKLGIIEQELRETAIKNAQLKRLIQHRRGEIDFFKKKEDALVSIQKHVSMKAARSVLEGSKTLSQSVVHGMKLLNKLDANRTDLKKRDTSERAAMNSLFLDGLDSNEIKRFKAKVFGKCS